MGRYIAADEKQEQENTKTPRKIKKEPEMVWIPWSHGRGRWVKKSAYEWNKKKDKNTGVWFWFILTVYLIIMYPSSTWLWLLAIIVIFIITK